MSKVHLTRLRNRLEDSNWIILDIVDGNDNGISETWVISRPNGFNTLHIEFEGPADSSVIPMFKSYSCKIKEYDHVKLIFSKISQEWEKDLDNFIEKLNQNG